jgi:methylmalonyl-CoA/ethylmalonyl-CoA epimerase
MGWKLDNGPFQLTNLSHIGIAVKDAETTVQALSKLWNLASPEIFDYEPKQDELFVGQAFKARLVWFQLGPVRIELLQPLDDRSIWHTFIQEKGEGIHHFAFGVSNYDEMVEKFKAEGHKLLVSAIFNGERWCYFDTAPGGTVIELREEYTKKP